MHNAFSLSFVKRSKVVLSRKRARGISFFKGDQSLDIRCVSPGALSVMQDA